MHFKPWPYPVIVAHRGGGHCAPENTLAAVRTGYERGYRAIECDAMCASDLMPILMHDSECGRTIAGIGKISDFSSGQLRQMDAGAWFNKQYGIFYKDVTVPLLEEILDFCQENAIWMNIEIKPVPGFEAITGQRVGQTVLKHVQHYSGQPLPVLSSFSAVALEAARRVAPSIPRALLVEHVPPDWEYQLQQLECVGLHCDYSKLNLQQAQAVKSRGYWLFCYTVNTLHEAQKLLEWGVDALCTDKLDHFQALNKGLLHEASNTGYRNNRFRP